MLGSDQLFAAAGSLYDYVLENPGMFRASQTICAKPMQIPNHTGIPAAVPKRQRDSTRRMATQQPDRYFDAQLACRKNGNLARPQSISGRRSRCHQRCVSPNLLGEWLGKLLQPAIVSKAAVPN